MLIEALLWMASPSFFLPQTTGRPGAWFPSLFSVAMWRVESMHSTGGTFPYWGLLQCRTGWCHDMEMLSALLALCDGKPLVTGGFPSQRASNISFGVFFDVSLNKLLNKQLGCQLLKASWSSCDITVIIAFQNSSWTQISLYLLTYFCVTQLFWNFALSTKLTLPCSVQNFKMFRQLRLMLWANGILWDWSLRCILEGNPTL